MDAIDWGLLLLLSVLWGGAYFFAGVAVRELPPLTVVLARVAIAAATLLPLFWFLGHRLPQTMQDWFPFFGMGLLNNVIPFGMIFAAQTMITVSLSSIINAMTPLFTVLVMAGFQQERLTLNRVIGVLFGVCGVAVLQGASSSEGNNQLPGIMLCLGAALSYGFAALWGRKFLGGIAPVKSATCQLLCSSAVLCLIVMFIDQPWTLPMPGVSTVVSVVALAVFGTAAAYLVFFKILVRAGPSNVMLVTLLIPVTAVLLGNTFLGEIIRMREIVGVLVIGIGLLFIDGRLVSYMNAGRAA